MAGRSIDNPRAEEFNLYENQCSPRSSIQCDELSGLPLFSERSKLLKWVLNYLPLPFSVAEFGCGQKAGVVLRMLTHVHGIPSYALQRLLVMERDMSAAAIAEKDCHHRPHALIAENPLASRVDLQSPAFHRYIKERAEDISIEDDVLRAGNYRIQIRDRVQFATARSHIAVVVNFWDPTDLRVVKRIVDVTLDRTRLFPVETIRHLLHAPEAWIFMAPMLGEFRLETDFLTDQQENQIDQRYQGDIARCEISTSRHSNLVRKLSGAEEGTIGDPATWTWVNNIFVGDNPEVHDQLRAQTGEGNPGRILLKKLIKACEWGQSDQTVSTLEKLEVLEADLGVKKALQEEAFRCERELIPLARAANAVSHFNSLKEIAKRYRQGQGLFPASGDPDRIRNYHGLGVSLRRRIEVVATRSRNDEGTIDARAFNRRFFAVVLETIRQMNRAGLRVCIDQVGNLHGLLLDKEAVHSIKSDPEAIRRLTGESLGFGSHLDTVLNAGKYAGRLGVFSGIEVAATLKHLQRCFELPLYPEGHHCPLMVSAYIGGELIDNGSGSAYSGSATVAGITKPESLLSGVTATGENYRTRLKAMWDFLSDSLDRDELLRLETAPPPVYFQPRHFYERNIERGSFLRKCGAPISLVAKCAFVSLAEAGIVLQLERSFGETHTPEETEMAADLLLGTLLQLDITREVLHSGTESIDSLYHLAAKHFPGPFICKTGEFYDACNLAFSRSRSK
ncbi:MAG: hypothetical protein P1U89_25855 [Verrucomicrobiales bacterium]|nr:hypothetical protein [Verrucomicrobiales bacterium]